MTNDEHFGASIDKETDAQAEDALVKRPLLLELDEKCPVCGELKTLDRLAVVGQPDVHLRRCAACGTVRTTPLPTTPRETSARYPLEIRKDQALVLDARAEKVLARLRRVHTERMLKQAGVTGGAALDIGCGSGALLRELNALGFTARGIELDDPGATVAKRMGATVLVGDVLTMPIPGGPFKLIVMRRTLEELADPKLVLTRARTLLADDGVLVVDMANVDSLQGRVAGSGWPLRDIPRHLVHLDARGLVELLRGLSYTVVVEDHLDFLPNALGWLESLVSLLGVRPKILRTVLMADQEARERELRDSMTDAVVAVALLPLLLPIVAGLTLVEGLLKKAGIVRVIAKKATALPSGTAA